MKKIHFDQHHNVISEQVRIQRKICGFSQQQLAAKLRLMGINADQQMISKIEHNRRIVTDYELACLCQVFSISPTELLSHFYALPKKK